MRLEALIVGERNGFSPYLCHGGFRILAYVCCD